MVCGDTSHYFQNGHLRVEPRSFDRLGVGPTNGIDKTLLMTDGIVLESEWWYRQLYWAGHSSEWITEPGAHSFSVWWEWVWPYPYTRPPKILPIITFLHPENPGASIRHLWFLIFHGSASLSSNLGPSSPFSICPRLYLHFPANRAPSIGMGSRGERQPYVKFAQTTHFPRSTKTDESKKTFEADESKNRRKEQK